MWYRRDRTHACHAPTVPTTTGTCTTGSPRKPIPRAHPLRSPFRSVPRPVPFPHLAREKERQKKTVSKDDPCPNIAKSSRTLLRLARGSCKTNCSISRAAAAASSFFVTRQCPNRKRFSFLFLFFPPPSPVSPLFLVLLGVLGPTHRIGDVVFVMLASPPTARNAGATVARRWCGGGEGDYRCV